MKKSRGLVLTLSEAGTIKIPSPIGEAELKSIIGGKVMMIVSPGNPNILGNRRARDPAALFVDLNTERSERGHYVSTFLPHSAGPQDKYALMKKHDNLPVEKDGTIIIPRFLRPLFEDTSRRVRLVLLKRNKSSIVDGFALQFEQIGLASIEASR